MTTRTDSRPCLDWQQADGGGRKVLRNFGDVPVDECKALAKDDLKPFGLDPLRIVLGVSPWTLTTGSCVIGIFTPLRSFGHFCLKFL